MLRRLYEATCGRFFVATYDRITAGTEAAGLRDARRELLAEARGETLEVGAGTGLNLDHWPQAVDRLVLSEPDSRMAAKLREKLAGRTSPAAEIVVAPAESLPFPDNSFDTVALTLVLCTVRDLPAALREVDRVLRPGGRLLFLEHVRSEDPQLARWQDRLHGPWKFVGHGCNCNRDTLRALEESPLEVERVVPGELPKAPPIVRPLITGSARAA